MCSKLHFLDICDVFISLFLLHVMIYKITHGVCVCVYIIRRRLYLFFICMFNFTLFNFTAVHSDRFLSQYFGSAVDIIPPMCHTHIRLKNYCYHKDKWV